MNEIRNVLDDYLRKTGKESIGAVEANALLDKAGILKDNPQRPGLPLRNKLRNGELPHAYQKAGKGSEWVIPLSTAERPAGKASEKKKGNSILQRAMENILKKDDE